MTSLNTPEVSILESCRFQRASAETALLWALRVFLRTWLCLFVSAEESVLIDMMTGCALPRAVKPGGPARRALVVENPKPKSAACTSSEGS
jgi:hypothetical protein